MEKQMPGQKLYPGIMCSWSIYCDSRSACYHVDDFERVRVKENALQIIRDELRRKVKTGVIGSGTFSGRHRGKYPRNGETVGRFRGKVYLRNYGRYRAGRTERIFL